MRTPSKLLIAAYAAMMLLLLSPLVEAGSIHHQRISGAVASNGVSMPIPLDAPPAHLKKNNHTTSKTKSLPIPITMVSGSRGQFTTVLDGNAFAYFEIPTGRNAALNVVVALDTFSGNCDSTVVNVKLESTLPEVDHGDSGSSNEKASDSIARAIMSLLQTSIFCAPRPELGVRVADTQDSPTYYLLLETSISGDSSSSVSGNNGSSEVSSSLCVVQTYYDYEDVGSFRARMYFISSALLGITVALIGSGLSVFRRPGFEMFGASSSPSAFLMTPLLLSRNLTIACAVACWKKLLSCMDKHRAEQAARRRREEATLLTPTAAASPDGGGACETIAATPTVLPDEDDDSCRICKEGAEGGELIRPCKCSGSCKFVHRECLDRWRIESLRRNQQNSTHCEICKSPFTIDLSRATRYSNLAKRITSIVLLVIGAYVLIVTTSAVARGTVGELSCLAPYHNVANAYPFGLSSAALGCFCYLIGGICVFYVHHYFYLVWRNDAEVRAHLDHHHILPEFMTWRLAIRIAIGCMVPFALFVAAGYWMKMLFYTAFKYSVWNWEISPFMGMLVAMVVGVFVVACLATGGRSGAQRRQEANEEEDDEARVADLLGAQPDRDDDPPEGDVVQPNTAEQEGPAAAAAVVVVRDDDNSPAAAAEGSNITREEESGTHLRRATTDAPMQHEA